MNKCFKKLGLIIVIFFIGLNISHAVTKDTLRFGLIKYKSLEHFENTYKPFINYIADKCDMIPYYQIVDDKNLGYMLDNNTFDIGIFKPFPYLKAQADFPQLEVFASHIAYGSDKYTGVIVVKKDSEIQTLKDIIGKKLLFVKPTSTSGYRIPKGILREHNIDINDSSLIDVGFSNNHIKSLKLLINGEVDAIAIDKKALLNFDGELDMNDLSILEEFEIPYNAYVFSSGIDSSTRNKIIDIMNNADKNPYANIFNNELGIEKWYECTDDNYNQLRRYLRIVRNKPTIKIKIDAKQNAIKGLSIKGDILSVFYDDLLEELENTNRFSVLDSSSVLNPDFIISINISLINKENEIFQFKTRKNSTVINKIKVNIDEIISKLPRKIIIAILKNTPITTKLFKNSEGWFITYGKSDGINITSYKFIISINDKKELTLEGDNIKEATPLNIYFENNEQFQKVNEVIIQYFSNGSIDDNDGDGILNTIDNCPDEYNPGQEDKNDNGIGDVCDKPWEINWDIIGIIFAIITGLVGLYFTIRKKRRFRHMLYQINDLLKEHIEGKFKLETQIIEQKEVVSRALESGKINENQFLILNHRIDEIETIVNNISVDVTNVSPDTEEEIEKILKDGIITEREYSRLMLILKNKKS